MISPFLSIFVIIMIVFVFTTTWTVLAGAPWVPTNLSSVHTMLEMADVGPDDVVYDLGCGDGRTLIEAARKYRAHAVGIEISFVMWFIC